MSAYSIISIIIIVLLTSVAVGIVYRIVSEKDRSEKITYIRNFKKGKCVVVYAIALPLYFIGYYYSKEKTYTEIVDAAVNTLNDVRDLVILKYRYNGIKALMVDNLLYQIAVYWGGILVFLNAVLFVISLGQQYIWEKRTRNTYMKKHTNKYVLIGYNEGNRKIYSTIHSGKAALVDDLSTDQLANLYKDGIVNFSEKKPAEFAGNMISKFGKEHASDKEKLYIIVNTEDDSKNIEICHLLAEKIGSLSAKDPNLYRRINVLVFGNPQYESLYSDATNQSGCIRIIDKYKNIAIDFVLDYPLSEGMNEEQIDFETSLVKEGIDINVIMVGFGDVNQQIFNMYVATNQFITGTSEDVVIKQVNYHIFDKEHAEYSKNFNHNYHRYQNTFFRYDKETKQYVPKVDVDKYLPLAELPANEIYHMLDINSPEFYEQISEIINKNHKGVNRIIIAYGDDLENFDLAQKLWGNRFSWKTSDIQIFSRARKENSCEIFGKENDQIIFFGNEERVLYQMDELDDSRLLKMALKQNRFYQEERARKKKVEEGSQVAMTEEEIKEIHENADRKWFLDWTESKRQSSMYAILSIRSKLLMMGLDYRMIKSEESKGTVGLANAGSKDLGSVEWADALSWQQYMEWYAKDDFPEVDEDQSESGAPGISRRVGIDFAISRARNMAILEHFRWNAYMISKGIVPAKKKVILEEKNESGKFTNGNNYVYRYHGNITTFDGLVEYRKMVAQRDHCQEEKTDVINYDYQIMDDAWWLLKKMGYGIVKVD